MPTTQSAIVIVAIQPSTRNQPPMVNSPMMFDYAVIIIKITMIGTATTPLMTALQ
jgi:hypothetical protein